MGSRVILLKDQEQSSVPTLSRSSGDSLILFSDSNYLNTVYLCTVTESGYTLPLSFGMYGFSAPYAYSNISKNFEGIALDPNTLEVLPDSYTSTGIVQPAQWHTGWYVLRRNRCSAERDPG